MSSSGRPDSRRALVGGPPSPEALLLGGLRLAAAAPAWFERQAAERLLNRVFGAALSQGELDFLCGRRLGLHVEDAGLFQVWTCEARRLRLLARGAGAEATIRGSAGAFVLMASRRMDPDALFFQRRIVIEGAVELALAVKNFLDGFELEALPLLLRLPLAAVARALGRAASPASEGA